ncbi:MAG: DUF2764 family protein [Candidatus Omnitrophica bacterium]|nr:DUF2764 family protein [Candidatus Omnitrophota bacterium]
MGNSYYYFISSLPLVSLEGKLPLSTEEFLSYAGEHLTNRELGMLRSVLSGENMPSIESNDFIHKWNVFNHDLSNEKARFRAQLNGKDPLNSLIHPVKENYNLAAVINQAQEAANPFLAEKTIDSARWSHLEELTFGHYFDFEYIVSYAIKLQIAERYSRYSLDDHKSIYRGYEEKAKEEKLYEIFG